jgi:hypothetical protein
MGLKAIFASVVMALAVLVAQQVTYSKFFLPLYVALGGITYVTTIKVLRALNGEDFQLIQQVAGEKLAMHAKRFFGFSEDAVES